MRYVFQFKRMVPQYAEITIDASSEAAARELLDDCRITERHIENIDPAEDEATNWVATDCFIDGAPQFPPDYSAENRPSSPRG